MHKFKTFTKSVIVHFYFWGRFYNNIQAPKHLNQPIKTMLYEYIDGQKLKYWSQASVQVKEVGLHSFCKYML